MPLTLRWVLLLAFSLRCLIAGAVYIFLRDSQAFYAKDTWSYLQPAIELIRLGSFTTHQQPELFRPPGYPILLSIGVVSGQIEAITIALQILLSCCTVYLVYRIADDLFNDAKAAMASAILFSVEPLSIISCSWLLSETLYLTLLALAVFFLIQFFRELKMFAIVAAAIAMALAVFVRPIGYFLPCVIAVAIFGWELLYQERKYLKPILVFLLVTFSLLGVWQVRNYLQTGYGGFSVAMTYNLYFHQIAAVEANHQQRSFYDVLDEMGFYDPAKYLQAHPEQQTWMLAERYEYMQREGLAAVWRAPIFALRIYVRGLAISLFDPGATEYLRLFRHYPRSGKLLNTMVSQGIWAMAYHIITQQPLLFLLSAILGAWLLFIYGTALIGLRSQPLRLPLVLLILIGLYHLGLSGGTLASGRFRMPLMLIACIFAGLGMVKAATFFTTKWPQLHTRKAPRSDSNSFPN